MKKKPFDPWTATMEDARIEAERLLTKHGLYECSEDPRKDPIFQWGIVQRLLRAERKVAENHAGTDTENWGVVLLSCIGDALEAGIHLPLWVSKELRRIVAEIESGRPSGNKEPKNLGWNNQCAFGWPYPSRKSPLISKKNERLAFYIYYVRHSKEFKEEIDGEKINRGKFDRVAKILKEKKIVQKLSGSMAEKIYGEYKEQIKKTLSTVLDKRITQKL